MKRPAPKKQGRYQIVPPLGELRETKLNAPKANISALPPIMSPADFQRSEEAILFTSAMASSYGQLALVRA